jgi:DNA-binding transcriptional LysR family regulator
MLKEYPGLTVNLVTGIPAPDLIADGLDVVIRVGALQDSRIGFNPSRIRQVISVSPCPGFMMLRS